MHKLREVLRTATVGGLMVVLPTILLIWIVQWLAGMIGEELAPVAAAITRHFGFPPWFAMLLAASFVVAVCFVIGLIVKTRSGAYMVHLVEEQILGRIPGYRTLKDVVRQFGDRDDRVFSEAALVAVGPIQAMGFITDRDARGVTVFIPTSPMPTQGLVLHLPAAQVIPIDLPANEVFKAIIGCGVNSRRLLGDARVND